MSFLFIIPTPPTPPDPADYVKGLGSNLVITPYAGTETARTVIQSFRGISDDGTYFFNVTSGVNASTGTSGAGGMDTGAVASDTVYYLYLIGDSTGANPVSSLISLSATSPAMPAGYNKKRLVGSLNTNSVSQLRPLRKVNDLVSYLDPVKLQDQGDLAGPFGPVSKAVTNYTSDLAYKIRLRIHLDTFPMQDLGVVYRAFKNNYTGPTNPPIYASLKVDAVGGTSAYGNLDQEGWVDIETLVSVRQFAHQLDAAATYAIYLVGFQETF